MGPGRKPRKEQGRLAAVRAYLNAWLQWGLGENPGRNADFKMDLDARVKLQWGLGENPGRNIYRLLAVVPFPATLQWGLGENPGRNSCVGSRTPGAEPLQWGLGENPGRNHEISVSDGSGVGGLQWGLGENPGRNDGAPRGIRGRRFGFNGAWAKTQEGTAVPAALGADVSRPASMGPGRKPRKELSRRWLKPSWRTSFNGAWAKTQEGTAVHRAPPCSWAARFNGAWAKTQEGTGTEGHEARDVGVASMGPGRKPRKEPYANRHKMLPGC